MLKKILIAVVVLLLLGAGYKFAIDNKLLAAPPLPASIAQVLTQFSFQSPEALEQTELLSTRFSSQASSLSGQLQEVGGQVQQVLGTAVEVAPDSEKPLHEKAVDYGKYLYCKQVVEEYEKKN
jgi:hypothetical protein